MSGVMIQVLGNKKKYQSFLYGEFYSDFSWRFFSFMANFNIFTNFYLKFLWRILWRTSATFCLVTLTHQTNEIPLTEKCHFARKNLASGESGWFGLALDTHSSFKRVQGFFLAYMCGRKVTALWVVLHCLVIWLGWWFGWHNQFDSFHSSVI